MNLAARRRSARAGHHSRPFAPLLLLAAATLPGLATDLSALPAASYLGTWRIEKRLEGAPPGDITEKDLSRIIGSTLTFTATRADCLGRSMSTFGSSVKDPIYSSMDVQRDIFERTVGVTFAQPGVGDDTVKLVAVLNDPAGETGVAFYVLGEDLLLLNSLGTFFVMRRAQSPSQSMSGGSD